MHDLPEPLGPSAAWGSRASRSNYYPLLSEGCCAPAKRGLDSAPGARLPARGPALARSAWLARPGPGERGPRLPALACSLAARSCSFPSCLRSPCQPAFLCLFSRLKGALRRWKTSLTSRQKREKGLGSKVVLLGLPRWYGAGGEGKRLARPAEQKHRLSQELCNFSQPWPLRLDFRPSA